MLKQRKKYIRDRQIYRDKQIINEELYESNSTSDTEDSDSDISDEYILKRGSVIIETSNQNENNYYDASGEQNNDSNKLIEGSPSKELINKFKMHSQSPTSSVSPSGSPVPAIVINFPPNENNDNKNKSQYTNSNQPNPFFLQPSKESYYHSSSNDRDHHHSHRHQIENTASSSSSPNNNHINLFSDKNMTNELYQTNHQLLPSSPSTSNEIDSYKPTFITKLKGKMKAENRPTITNVINTSFDAFTFYYAQESNIDSMNSSDVNAIVKKLENNKWCGKLRKGISN